MFRKITTLFITACLLSTVPSSAEVPKAPYWAVVGTDLLNMRVGPSVNYKIAWVYKRKGLPLKVIRVIDGWRLVRDHAGVQGWVNSGLIRQTRGGMVIGKDAAAMRDAPRQGAKLKWRLAPGVIGRLGPCEGGWCLLNVAGREGWVAQDRLWGAGEP